MLSLSPVLWVRRQCHMEDSHLGLLLAMLEVLTALCEEKAIVPARHPGPGF